MSTAIDINSFEAFFKEHHRFLYLVSFQLVKDEEVAKDTVQDFFLNVWQKRNEITINASFSAYATRAVKNRSLNYLQGQKRIDKNNQALLTDDYEPDALDINEEHQNKETIDMRVMQLVDLLPSDRKKIFLAFTIDDLSYAQIAEKYEVSINTVKTQMKRAYAFMKLNLKDDAVGILILSMMFWRLK